MATHVVNNATDRDAERSGTGWVVAIIALLAIVLLFLFAGVFFNDNAAAPSIPGTGTGAAGSVDLDMGGSAGVGGSDAGAAQ